MRDRTTVSEGKRKSVGERYRDLVRVWGGDAVPLPMGRENDEIPRYARNDHF